MCGNRSDRNLPLKPSFKYKSRKASDTPRPGLLYATHTLPCMIVILQPRRSECKQGENARRRRREVQAAAAAAERMCWSRRRSWSQAPGIWSRHGGWRRGGLCASCACGWRCWGLVSSCGFVSRLSLLSRSLFRRRSRVCLSFSACRICCSSCVCYAPASFFSFVCVCLPLPVFSCVSSLLAAVPRAKVAARRCSSSQGRCSPLMRLHKKIRSGKQIWAKKDWTEKKFRAAIEK